LYSLIKIIDIIKTSGFVGYGPMECMSPLVLWPSLIRVLATKFHGQLLLTFSKNYEDLQEEIKGCRENEPNHNQCCYNTTQCI